MAVIHTHTLTYVVTFEVLTVAVPRIQVFPRHSVSGSRHLEGLWCFWPEGVIGPGRRLLDPWKTKAPQSFEMSGTTHPVTMSTARRLNPHDIHSTDLLGGYVPPKRLALSAFIAYCYPQCWL